MGCRGMGFRVQYLDCEGLQFWVQYLDCRGLRFWVQYFDYRGLRSWVQVWTVEACGFGFCVVKDAISKLTQLGFLQVIVQARKPAFFNNDMSMYEVVTSDGLMRPCYAAKKGTLCLVFYSCFYWLPLRKDRDPWTKFFTRGSRYTRSPCTGTL